MSIDRRLLLAAACLAAFLPQSWPTPVHSAPAEETPARSSAALARPYQLEFNARIPMRDGVELSGTFYRPADQTEPLPVILVITPYVSQRFEDVGAYFAAHGYVFAAVDSRGRGNSNGEFEPWSVEGPDGYDVVEWLARQPWSDGQVAMWGGSYSGKNQWMVAGETPPALRTIVPASAGYMDRAVPSGLGIDWLLLIAGRAANDNLRSNDDFWRGVYADRAKGLTTMRNLDRYVGYPNRYWQEWMNHPADDAYWDAASTAPDKYAGVTLPTLSITGQYDGAMTGTQRFRQLHLDAASPETAAQSYLVVGPWNHPGSRVPKQHLGGLDFGPDSVLDVKALHVAWYDHVMKGAPLPAFLKDRFVFYVSGANVWESAPSYEAATGRRETVYLSSPSATGGRLGDVGALTAAAAPGQPSDQYVYDPAAPSYDEGVRGGGAVSENFLTDDRQVRRLDGDGLIYETAPLEQAADLVGVPKATLQLTMDVPDTDIQVILHEVKADGSTVFLAEDMLRARYRKSSRQEVLATPGAEDEYVFDGFAFVARRIEAGSRIRMIVLPEGASIYAEHNRNSGGVVADETPADNRVAHVQVRLGGADGSRVELPWRS